MQFRKVLIPTDGSDLSNAAAHAGVDFARDHRADVVGIYVAPEYTYPLYADSVPASYPGEEQYRTAMREVGNTYLKEIRGAAENAQLGYTGFTVFSDSPANEIAGAAQANDCDLIFMGSHGRGGWRRFFLGSVTSKVLSLCQVPVLVYRLARDAAGSDKHKP